LQAQQVFRIVGPDGKVTFSDKPPVATNAKVTTGAGSNAAGGGSGNAALPFELRQIAQKYPVTLYTGDNCSPCQSARTLLLSRGIPFVEKTVNTNDDALALQRLSGDTSLPFATIGGQQLKGFSDSEWTQFLNAAAYPSTSLLPASYKQPPATPMVAVSAASANAAARAPAAPAAAPAPAVQAAPAPANPAGIRF
jgi:glutaredoxin